MPSDSSARSPGGGEPAEAAERRRVIEVLSAATLGVEPVRVPQALCRACVGLLPVTGASVSISGGSTVRAVWCASDEVAAQLAEAQYTVGDGPCRAALDGAVPVLAADLADGPDSRRWPIFARQAVELGVGAVFSLPLGAGGSAIGTLDLYRDRPGGLSERDLAVAQWVRDAIMGALMELRSRDAATGRAPDDGMVAWVAASEAEHGEVYQAIGMVMVQLGVDPADALDRMRARAFVEEATVSEVARDVVAHRLKFRPEADG
ncbi:GAF and ANTAR domain-containing protein [Streptomyces sp. NPDC006458]|uniref:GAF and ANTAR domain-containing protein n=1 Tax=Streptomyces sp. NPDC006458 TaxID=3154302 RepID=UPI0033AE5B22